MPLKDCQLEVNQIGTSLAGLMVEHLLLLWKDLTKLQNSLLDLALVIEFAIPVRNFS